MKNLLCGNKAKVAIVKVNSDIDTALSELFTLLGGIESYILPFQNVLIKPNWVAAKSYQSGAVTHPELIRSCVKQVLKCGIKQICVGDSSMVGEDTEKVIELNALRDIESKRVKIIDFKKSEYLPLAVPNACKYRRLSFPKELLDAHFVINMPVLKTHDYFPATLGLKNMKGVLKDVDKRRFHTLGLEEGIIDTNRVALADFTIIDGIIGMEGSGPINGIPANSRIIIGSDNALAAEIIALKVMGIDSEHLPYIQMAYDAGFGEKNLDKIEVVGAKCEEVSKKFQLSNANKQDFFDGSICISMENACSTCKFIVSETIKSINENNINKKTKVTLVCGGDNISQKENMCYLGIGNCNNPKRDEYTSFVSGCPPKKSQIIKELQNLGVLI